MRLFLGIISIIGFAGWLECCIVALRQDTVSDYISWVLAAIVLMLLGLSAAAIYYRTFIRR